jgi:hypothetical protein
MFRAFKLSLDVAILTFWTLFSKNWAKFYSISGHTGKDRQSKKLGAAMTFIQMRFSVKLCSS